MALTEEEARRAAANHIASINSWGYDLVILVDMTIAKPYGWIYFYNTREFVETGDMLHALGGNGPVVVERESGRVISLATNVSVEESIRRYELVR